MAYKLENTEQTIKSVTEKIKKADDLIIKLDGVLNEFKTSNEDLKTNKLEIEGLISKHETFLETIKSMQKDHQDFVEKKTVEAYQENTKRLMDFQLDINKKFDKVYEHIEKNADSNKELLKLIQENTQLILKKSTTQVTLIIGFALTLIIFNIILLLT